MLGEILADFLGDSVGGLFCGASVEAMLRKQDRKGVFGSAVRVRNEAGSWARWRHGAAEVHQQSLSLRPRLRRQPVLLVDISSLPPRPAWRRPSKTEQFWVNPQMRIIAVPRDDPKAEVAIHEAQFDRFLASLPGR